MLPVSRVLHATDFSPTSWSALRYAMRIASTLGIRLDVVHVIPSIGASRFAEVFPHSNSDVPNEFDRKIHEQFEAQGLPASPEGIELHFLVGRGPLPGPVILDLARQDLSTLIVVGTHGAQHDRVGSVATDLIQRSTCPVMLVPANMREEALDREFRRVVTYVSFARLIEPVIVFAFQFARTFGAHLDILAVTHNEPADSRDAPEDAWASLERKLWKTIEMDTKNSVKPFEDVQLHLRCGRAAEEIDHFAREQESDFLIIEAPGLAAMESPLERMVEQIVNDSACPVIVVNSCGRPDVDTPAREAAAAI